MAAARKQTHRAVSVEKKDLVDHLVDDPCAPALVKSTGLRFVCTLAPSIETAKAHGFLAYQPHPHRSMLGDTGTPVYLLNKHKLESCSGWPTDLRRPKKSGTLKEF